MASRTATFYPERLSVRVPSMAFAADVNIETGMSKSDLGSPATLDADGLVASVALTSGVAHTATLLTNANGCTRTNAPFGRNVTITADGTCTRVATVTGRDYLNTKVVETITFAGNSTVQGKKAFFYVDSVSISSEANTPNITVGWGDIIGLPYKATAVHSAIENADPSNDENEVSELTVTGVDTAGTGTATFTAPFDGYIIGWRGVHTTAMTTAPSAIALTVAAAAAVAGDGLAPIAVAGLVFGKNIIKSSWVAVTKGQSCVLTSDGAGTAGVSDFTMVFSRGVGTFTPGDATTATATTGDVRGTYQPGLANNGSRALGATIECDRSNLHGVAQYAG